VTRLRRIAIEEVPEARVALPGEATTREAGRIVEDVRARGEEALREHAERLGDLGPHDRLTWDRQSLDRARDAVEPAARAVLERAAESIGHFAAAQRESLREVRVAIPGGWAGHSMAPVASAGCYAPGGRFPLPSSVLMTVVTARAAGVSSVWVASPRPSPVTLAAASIAGADGLLAAGGAHAIAALAFGAGPVPRCDLIAGPGNRWVTAAKRIVAGEVGVDLVAGPSELVVLADLSADAELIAADLLAQAEHDPDAVPILVTPDPQLAARVEAVVEARLPRLATAATAAAALANGGIVLVPTIEAGIEVCNRLAPEHLEVITREPNAIAARLVHYGALFLGRGAGEVLGDYGAGPNHVLPTGGAARFSGGLSVFTFLRVRTWMQIDDLDAARPLLRDTAHLARLEGLDGHAQAAEARLAGR